MVPCFAVGGHGPWGSGARRKSGQVSYPNMPFFHCVAANALATMSSWDPQATGWNRWDLCGSPVGSCKVKICENQHHQRVSDI